MIPLYNTNGDSTCPLGLPMCQNRLAVPTWSYAMEIYPPTRIVELGTYGAGFTTAIGVHAYRIGAKIITYDQMIAPDQRFADLAKFLGIVFRNPCDIWKCEDEIAKLIASPGISYVLCDGGDKPRELALFAPYLKPGDVIAAHDYNHMAHFTKDVELMAWPWGEITREQGVEVATANGLEPFLQEHFDFAGWLAFKKPG